MAYTKTVWTNDTAPAINASNLNKMEQGIYDSHEAMSKTMLYKADLTNSNNLNDLTGIGLYRALNTGSLPTNSPFSKPYELFVQYAGPATSGRFTSQVAISNDGDFAVRFYQSNWSEWVYYANKNYVSDSINNQKNYLMVYRSDLTSADDLNSLNAIGIYRVLNSSSQPAHSPFSDIVYELFVQYAGPATSGSFTSQLAVGRNGEFAVRFYQGTWSEWINYNDKDTALLEKIQDGSINIWDEEWEVGNIGADGSNVSSNRVIRTKNHIRCEEETGYYFHVGSDELLSIICYDENKTVFNGSTWINNARSFTNSVFITPAGTKYIRFVLSSDYGITYNKDVSLNYPSNITSYIPAWLKGNKEYFKKISDNFDNFFIPTQEMKTALTNFMETVQISEADLRLLVFSDPHSSEKDRYAKYKYFMEQYGCFDGLVCLGDTMDYVSTGLTRQYAKKNLAHVLSYSGRMQNCFFVVGNHDIAFSYANNGPLSDDYTLSYKEMFDCLNRQNVYNANFDPENPFCGYYYVDFEPQKIRMIVLNTSDIWEADGTLAHKYEHSVMYHQRQITWFSNIALDLSEKVTPADWHILVCHHAKINTTSREDGIIVDILRAVKAGNNLNKSWTIQRRLTYNSETDTYSSVVDTSESDTFTVTKDYSLQGAVDVIGILSGHLHFDQVYDVDGIKIIEFGNDNPIIYNLYECETDGLSAGSYAFTDADGTAWKFTSTTTRPQAVKIAYNLYLARVNNTCPVYVYDNNGNSIAHYSATKAAAQTGDTTLIFEASRSNEVEQNSSYVVSIDAAGKTIKKDVFGAGIGCNISYA